MRNNKFAIWEYAYWICLSCASIGALFGEDRLVFNGETLELMAGLTLSRPIILNAEGGTFLTDHPASATISTNIGGIGNLTKTGTGILLLTGMNTYGGNTIFKGGTVQISSPSNLGFNNFSFSGGTLELLPSFGTHTFTNSMTLGSGNGTLQTDTSVNATFSGSLGGTGALIKTGPGKLILTGTINHYSGGTTIQDGTLQGNSITLQGPITNNSELIFNQIGTGTYGGQISGTGNVTIQNNSTLNLTGTNNYAGTTTLNGGIVQVSSPTNLGVGAIIFNESTLQLLTAWESSTLNNVLILNAENGTLQTDTSVNATFAGNIEGAGSLTKTGPGKLILTGNNTYNGPTTISAGTLIVNGVISNSPITIENSATLAGNGTVGNVTFNSGSNYFVEIGETRSDLILATGTVTINPGTSLTLSSLEGSSPQLPMYTIITALEGVIQNAPFTLSSGDPNVRYLTFYDSNHVFVVLQSFNQYVASGETGAIVKCFNTLINKRLPDLENFITMLAFQSQSERQTTFTQMSPADFNSIAFAQENVAERIRQTYSRHLLEANVLNCSQNDDSEKRAWSFWAAPFVEWVHQDGHENLKGYQETFAGFTTALDYQLKEHWIFTTGFSYSKTHVKMGHLADAHSDSYAGSLGTLWTNSHFFADALFSYLHHKTQAERAMHFNVATPLFSYRDHQAAAHPQHSHEFLEHLGGGYDFKVWHTPNKTIHLYPFVNGDYTHTVQSGYQEKGAQSLDLKVHQKNYDLLRTEIGLGSAFIKCSTSGKWMGEISLSYAHERRFQGKKTKAGFKNSSCQFTVNGLLPTNDLICPSAIFSYAFPEKKVAFTLGYHGEYGKKFIENVAEGELKFSF